MAGDAGTVSTSPGHSQGSGGWIDRSLLSLCLASLIVTVVAGLIQLRHGSFEMSLEAAWRAVFDRAVLFDPEVWERFLLGGEFNEDAVMQPGQWDSLIVEAPLPELATETIVVWTIRLPRVLVAALVGMNLAVSGAIFQAVTRNELASPFVLGVSSGAGLAVLVTLVFFTGLVTFLPVIAALGGAMAFLLVYVLAWNHGTSPVRLVLAGIVVATVFKSLQTSLFFFADDIGVVQTAIAWTTGSLTGAEWEQVRTVLPWTVLSMGLALLGSRQLNVLLLGEQTARSLGMRVERVRFGLSGVAVLAASASIAVAGIVSFVGLIVPHLVRMIVGSDYRKLIVGCLFAGPALMVTADLGARLGLQVLFGADAQIPAGVVTGIIGGPFFLYLLRSSGQIGEL